MKKKGNFVINETGVIHRWEVWLIWKKLSSVDRNFGFYKKAMNQQWKLFTESFLVHQAVNGMTHQLKPMRYLPGSYFL